MRRRGGRAGRERLLGAVHTAGAAVVSGPCAVAAIAVVQNIWSASFAAAAAVAGLRVLLVVRI